MKETRERIASRDQEFTNEDRRKKGQEAVEMKLKVKARWKNTIMIELEDDLSRDVLFVEVTIKEN